MASLLQQLENNEAVLLMYLAGELPAQDRAEVEQMLANDAGMRAALEALRDAQRAVDEGLAAADRSWRPAVPEHVAVRRFAQSLRQWHAAREARRAAAAAAPPLPELRFPWWSYPAATAAAVLLGFLVWWGNTDQTSPHAGPQHAYFPHPGSGETNPHEEWLAQHLVDSLTGWTATGPVYDGSGADPIETAEARPQDQFDDPFGDGFVAAEDADDAEADSTELVFSRPADETLRLFYGDGFGDGFDQTNGPGPDDIQ